MGKGIISGADIAIHLVDLRKEQTWNQSGGAERDSLQCSLLTTGSLDTKTNSILKGNIIKIRSGTDSLLGHIEKITLEGNTYGIRNLLIIISDSGARTLDPDSGTNNVHAQRPLN